MQHKIKLRPDEVKDFVSAATRCDCDVDIFYNSFIEGANLAFNGYEPDFERTLRKWAVAV